MLAWCYQWLPVIFGCHCRDDRSFHWKNRRFPICARCTGELAGIVLGLGIFFLWQAPVWVCLVLMLPMIADGFCQLLTSYESKNPRRFLTGVLFGFGLYTLFAHCTVFAFQFGYHLAG